jgi:hypothetical protein
MRDVCICFAVFLPLEKGINIQLQLNHWGDEFPGEITSQSFKNAHMLLHGVMQSTYSLPLVVERQQSSVRECSEWDAAGHTGPSSIWQLCRNCRQNGTGPRLHFSLHAARRWCFRYLTNSICRVLILWIAPKLLPMYDVAIKRWNVEIWKFDSRTVCSGWTSGCREWVLHLVGNIE